MWCRYLLGVILWTISIGTVFLMPLEFDLLAEESSLNPSGTKSLASAQREEQGETAKAGYYSHQSNDKGEKGSFDRERHQNQYAEEGGNQLSHNKDGAYYADKRGTAHGQKGYRYFDKGSFAKGHDTKGHHNIRKIDEFQKNKEFFDEDRDAGFKEKFGEFGIGKAFKNGDASQRGYAHDVFFEGKYGLKGNAEKGTLDAQVDGKKKASGREQYSKIAEGLAKIGFGEFFKGFGFGKGIF